MEGTNQCWDDEENYATRTDREPATLIRYTIVTHFRAVSKTPRQQTVKTCT